MKRKPKIITFATVTIPEGLYGSKDEIDMRNHPFTLTKEGKKILRKANKKSK